jgi:hypothetical protein
LQTVIFNLLLESFVFQGKDLKVPIVLNPYWAWNPYGTEKAFTVWNGTQAVQNL